MKNKILFLFISALLIIISCAKEIDRITFDSLKTIEKEITLINDKNPQIWVDLNVEYDSEFSLLFNIELMQNDKVLFKSISDAMKVNTKIFSTEVTINNNHKIKYQGKLDFYTENLKAGIYKIRITPEAIGGKFDLKKYDIILKQ